VRVFFLTALALLIAAPAADAQRRERDFEKAPHNYWKRTPTDSFTKIKDDLLSGKIPLDRSSEKAFVTSVLKALDISPASQMLVFSTTSLQLSRISPRNPRALYFNEDIYAGWVPGGQLEIAAVDPDLGGIYYLFDIPRGTRPMLIARSTRCMNCHAEFEIGRIPGLLIKSVIPGPGGGSLEGFRQESTGHGIPFKERFGGWHVTGKHGIAEHWGNLVGTLSAKGLTKIPNPPGKQFRWDRYPVPTSDILAHLLHEHQVGFVNRAVKATYDVRTALHASDGKLTPAAEAIIAKHARELVRYILFADEVALPAGGIEGDALLKKDFLKNARKTKTGQSLRDFDLKTRLFKHRCSYMIHSAAFTGLPTPLKKQVIANLRAALDPARADSESSHLSADEKHAIAAILSATKAW